MDVISPIDGGASNSSPGPVNVDTPMLPPPIIFFRENLISPLRVTVGDMAIIAPKFSCQYKQSHTIAEHYAPGFVRSGHPMAS